MCPDTEPAMKLITMITSVGMKGGYHSLKNCCLTITCMATKTPNNLCEKQDSQDDLLTFYIQQLHC